MDNKTFLYVSTKGNDNWSGLIPEPDLQGKDGPFASLERARDAVREIKASNPLQYLTVYVKGGKYYLTEVFKLTKDDCGNDEFPVTYAAYPGEKPIISGGKRIFSWRHYKDGIYMSEPNFLKGGRWKSRQLFCDGIRMIRARWPKYDKDNPLYGGWAYIEDSAWEGSTTAFRYKPGTLINHWAKPQEGEVSIYMHYGGWMSKIPIKSLDEENRIITLEHGGYQFDLPPWHSPYNMLPDNRFYVENLLEELSEKSEWCFDSEEGVIYFRPPFDDIEKCEVVIPWLDCLFDVQDVSNVVISGFEFTETTDGDSLHPQGVEGAGAMFGRVNWKYVGDTLHMKNTKKCIIEKNHFNAVGGNAVYMEFKNHRNIIRDNEISYTGASGICLLGSKTNYPAYNDIFNNYIHNCGIINKGVAGVFLGMSDCNNIHHNRIEYVPHHAINISESPHGRNYIEYNEIHYACQENEDNGAINCWMEMAERESERCGHIIRYNLITDNYGCEVNNGKAGPSERFPTHGIYLDNYTSNCIVYGNIIVRCSHAGIRIHGGKNNLIENNIIIDCLRGIQMADHVSCYEYWHNMAGFMSGNVILRNIICNYGKNAFMFLLHAWTEMVVGKSDCNIFFDKNGDYRIEHWSNLEEGRLVESKDIDKELRITSLKEWMRIGYEKSSIIGEPGFVDVKNDNFSLEVGSPAVKIGFQNIDLREIGIKQEKNIRS